MRSLFFLAALCICASTYAFVVPALPAATRSASYLSTRQPQTLPPTTPALISSSFSPLFAVDQPEDAEEVTKKYGLEAGLFSIFKSGDNKEGKAVQAKDLLAKYGSAYLLTSISLSLVSFSLCYVLINAGVDVASLLAKVGIQASSQTETAGTVALAYAAHKAASPIRFPPTVALTPFVANAIGKKPVEEGSE